MQTRRGWSHHRGAVFVDLDEAIYPGSTIKDVGRWLLEHGQLPWTTYGKIVWWLLLRKLGRLDDVAAFREGVRVLAGRRLTDVRQAVEQAWAEDLASRLPPLVRPLLARLKRYVGPLVLATESLDIIAAAVARDLGFETFLATPLEVRQGRLTGRLAGPVLKGDAKTAAVRAWARTHHVDLAQSVAVGGRLEDAPLLRLVGRAIVFNPDRETRACAHAEGWEIIETNAKIKMQNLEDDL